MEPTDTDITDSYIAAMASAYFDGGWIGGQLYFIGDKLRIEIDIVIGIVIGVEIVV